VLSLLGFESDQSERRFVATFLRQLYRRKSRQGQPTRTLVVLDEAHLFVPENVRGDAAELAGAVQRIVRQGRSFGIGTLLVDQRPQDVSKRVITQCDTLICHQLVHKTDRDALRDWVRGYDVDGRGEQFLESLASLEPGEAWVWSPGWLKLFKRVKVHRRKTFDSGAAPDGSAAARTVQRADVDLDALRGQLAEVVEKAKADDPKELRRRSPSWSGSCRTGRPRRREVEKVVATPKPPAQVVEVPVLKNGQLDPPQGDGAAAGAGAEDPASAVGCVPRRPALRRIGPPVGVRRGRRGVQQPARPVAELGACGLPGPRPCGGEADPVSGGRPCLAPRGCPGGRSGGGEAGGGPGVGDGPLVHRGNRGFLSREPALRPKLPRPLPRVKARLAADVFRLAVGQGDPLDRVTAGEFRGEADGAKGRSRSRRGRRFAVLRLVGRVNPDALARLAPDERGQRTADLTHKAPADDAEWRTRPVAIRVGAAIDEPVQGRAESERCRKPVVSADVPVTKPLRPQLPLPSPESFNLDDGRVSRPFLPSGVVFSQPPFQPGQLALHPDKLRKLPAAVGHAAGTSAWAVDPVGTVPPTLMAVGADRVDGVLVQPIRVNEPRAVVRGLLQYGPEETVAIIHGGTRLTLWPFLCA
jgi:hypothetical protein